MSDDVETEVDEITVLKQQLAEQVAAMRRMQEQLEAGSSPRMARQGKSPAEKMEERSMHTTYLNSLVQGVGKDHPQNATEADNRSLITRFEERARFSIRDLHVFQLLQLAIERSPYSTERMNHALSCANVRKLYLAAMQDENAADAYMLEDDSGGEYRSAPDRGDFTEFWKAFRAEFLSEDPHTWAAVHEQRWKDQAKMQGDLTLAEWVSNTFQAQDTAEDNNRHTPTDDDGFRDFRSAVSANQLVANCCPALRATLLSEHKSLVLPKNQHRWSYEDIYQALLNIEHSPSYVHAARERKELEASVARNALAAQAAHSQSSGSQLNTGPASCETAKTDRPTVVNRFGNVTRWDELTREQQMDISEKKKRIALLTPVPGLSGRTQMTVKSQGQWTKCEEGTPGAFWELCYDWKRDTGGPNQFHCEKPGHWVVDCPCRKSAQVNAVAGAQKARPIHGADLDRVSAQDFRTFQTHVMRALQRLNGEQVDWD